MSSGCSADDATAVAEPRQQRPAPKRAAKRQRQLRLTSILSRSQLVDLANEVAHKEEQGGEGEEGQEQELSQQASGDDESSTPPAARASPHTTTRRARSVEKHVDAVLQQFIEFERKHFWNRGGSDGCGADGVTAAAGSGNVLPQFNIHHDAAGGADVPRVLKTTVAARCGPLTSRVVRADVSGNGDTVKLLVELQDGFQVESVIMRHTDERSGRHTRATLCVSSQVGCKMGCKFCATGTLGELGNLSSGEILEQLVFANRINDTPMRNVVFMGMGEPLNNYANVVEAVRIMTSPRGFGLAASRVTVSTVGIVPRMEQLVRDLPQVAMALSLHAPTQGLRADIVPAARGWKMGRLMAALDEYTRVSGRAALVQYILLAEVNDTPEVGAVLATLLHGRSVKLNLIPYNPNHSVGITQFQAPSPERVAAFMAQLRAAGIFTTVRKEMGQDVAGACGQLALTVRQQGQAQAQQLLRATDTAPDGDGSAEARGSAAPGASSRAAGAGGAGAGAGPQASDDIEDLIGSAATGGGATTVNRRPSRSASARRPHNNSSSSGGGGSSDALPGATDAAVVARTGRSTTAPAWTIVALCVLVVSVALVLLLPGQET